MQSFSQLGEDIYCFQNFINIPRKDIVLFEIGAFDGRTYSNTFAQELFSKGKAVLVEPSPLNVSKIYRNRPSSSIHRLAIMNSYGVCKFSGNTSVSGVTDELTEQYVQKWKLQDSQNYNVLSAPLSSIVEIEAVNFIDFISIDVQGAEFFVLASMNWKIPVGTICIELEGERPEYDEACRGILRGLGFIYKCRLHISEFWINPTYFRSSLLFDASKRMPIDSFECLFFKEEWKNKLKDNFY